MLDRLIQSERIRAADDILRCYRERYLPHAVLAPSARFGLYAAAKEFLSVGDRVIISPITCRTVIYALMEAGVIPVYADIELATGNLDPGRIPDALLNDAQAIVTTNLYGNPDCVLELKRMAGARRMLLIEDCAHVLHTSVRSREIGSFGDVSVFSFKKYFHEPGGVVTLRNEAARRRLEARIKAESAMPSPAEESLRYMQLRMAQATSRSLVARLSRMYTCVHAAVSRSRPTTQTPTDGWQGWPAQRVMPFTASLLRVAGYLARRERLVAERMASARALIAQCPLAVKSSGYADEVCYLAVPFFFSRRDAVVSAVRQQGIATYFLYTPPMNVLFGGNPYRNHSLDAEMIDRWCRNILPINPQFSREYLEAIRNLC